MFEYGRKRNLHHIKNHRTTYIRIKEKEEEKEESVYNPFLYFMSSFKNSFLQTYFSSNTTQRLINNNVQKCSKRFKNIQGERIIYYDL